MAKKSGKKQFDWKTYSRPPRLLSPHQEAALSEGILAPVLERSLSDPQLRFDIRARAANLYHRGSLVMRLAAGQNDDAPFIAEFEPAAAGLPARLPLSTAVDVADALERLESAAVAVDAAWNANERSERDYLQAIAEAHSGHDLFESDYVVIDIEYLYGKRRFDLVALQRVEGVTGPGGFAHARLVFADVRCCGQTLGGASGLDAVGGDLAEFAKALGGSHLQRARIELEELTRQKVRLGLLPPELEIREIDSSLPGLLVLFAESDVGASERDNAAIVSLHERLASRHYPTDLLRFAVLPEVPAGGQSPSTALRDEQLMTYREFKEYRSRTSG